MRFIVVVLLVLVGVGVWYGFDRGWFQVAVTKNADETETKTSLTVNQGKIKEDVAKLTHPAKANGANPNDATTPTDFVETTVMGRLQTVGTDQVALTNANGQLVTVGVNPQTQVRLGAKDGALQDLRVGDQATVVYVTREQKMTAVSIRVTR